MEKELLSRIRTSLHQKREVLTSWLATMPAGNRQMHLAAAPDRLVYAHLERLDDAIARCDSGTLGRCEVCQGEIEPELLEVDYTCCVCLEDMSAEEARRLESELELAQRVQQSLLPQQVPEIPHLDVAAYSRPAQIVGGDYFDFFGFADGKQGLTIADVAGHGISASLHMASVQTLLRTLVPANSSPAEVVRRVQHLYSHNINFTTFVTLCLAAYDATENRLTYCNAGHNPPLLARRGGRADAVQWLRPTGAAVGLLDETEFGEETVLLQPDDTVVFYTDGVTEAMNPQAEQYGRQRLATLVGHYRGSPARDVLATIRQDMNSFADGRSPEDDVTIIVSRVLA
jgi:sigma-B regulation protein RsbU (phosphoserine phosphatase)